MVVVVVVVVNSTSSVTLWVSNISLPEQKNLN
jgi:hypothetical protein